MNTAGPILALDTATRTPVVALADAGGAVVGERRWLSRHRHGEELLQRLDELLVEAGVPRVDLAAVVVGTGPGSFTGLRIGLATAKVVAYSLRIPIAGVSTAHALALAAVAGSAPAELAVSLPAGAADRYVCRLRVNASTVDELAPPRLVADGADFAQQTANSQLVAVDLDAPDVGGEAIERGQRALEGLASALASLGARRLAAQGSDDVATLVPAYVALPRGIEAAAQEMQWSPDLR
jgi:tRNA threonylcarbamoyladenosine biosynthesis protein TsaB